MQVEYFDCFFEPATGSPERPLAAIGSGQRRVFAMLGWKWVWLIEPRTLATVKLPRRIWDRLHPVLIEHPDWHTLARQFADALRRSGETPSRFQRLVIARCRAAT